MVSSYPYRSLHFPDETRVLVIEPGQFTDPLTGKLHHVSVSPESSDSFDALSYCWTCSTETPPPEDKFEISPTATYDVQNAPNLPKGAPMEGTPHETICELLGRMLTIHCARYESLFYKYGMWPLPEDVLVLDGVEVNIGGELAAVLRRLRSTNEEIRIWVDAVCINQNDIGEKNEHVKIMGTIYSRASMVHVWLGEQYGGEESALETLVGVLKIFKEMAERTNGAMDENAEDFQRRFFEDERVRNLDFAELDELLQRSWFDRVWVIQEIAKAAAATLHVGPLKFDWETFASAIGLMQTFRVSNSQIQSLDGSKSLALMNILRQERGVKQEDRRFPLLELIEETRHFKSTMPVDKIYAILGLVHDNNIPIDYNAKPEDVFRQFAIQYLRPQQNLDILYHCVVTKQAGTLDIPSWVPDWTRPGYVEPFRIRDLRCNAGGKAPISLRFENNDKTLVIKGRLIDTIEEIDGLRPIPQESIGPEPNHRYPSYDNARRQEATREAERKWLKSARDFALPEGDATAPAVREAFWRTFMFNSTRYHEPPDAEACALGCNMYFEAVVEDTSIPQILRERKKKRVDEGMDDVAMDEQERRGVDQFLSGFLRWGRYRRFFRSRDGHFGWSVDGAQVGDWVVVLDGGKYPLVLRGKGQWYTIVGDCYIHWFMNGEALERAGMEFRIV